jgi:phospholipase C
MNRRTSLAFVLVVIGAAAACSGDKGDTGATGPAGSAGSAGAPGSTGPAGATGPAGTAGSPGANGDAGPSGTPGTTPDGSPAGQGTVYDPAAAYATKTQIKHVVVVFGENVSFDHYFGTYPNATNPDAGDPAFTAAAGTPTANTLETPLNVNSASFPAIANPTLLTANPNDNGDAGSGANGANASNPFRLASLQAETADQGHGYTAEQGAYDNGLMDLFPAKTGSADSAGLVSGTMAPAAAGTKGIVMAYFDGNTLQTFWGYAQAYALNDNSYTTQFGPSSPGAINLISGQTNGAAVVKGTSGNIIPDGNNAGGMTMIGDIDPANDTCSSATTQGSLSGKNVGDLLNAKGITWGWFQGGFDLTVTNANGTTGCARSTPQTAVDSTTSSDYVPHHQPFQYYASTANPMHVRPSSVEAIGHSTLSDGTGVEPANHQYDTHDFFDALGIGNLPAVSYLKAPSFEDGHPGNSNPVYEQNFAKRVVAALQDSPFWDSTAIVFAYDDSDGWYDHQAPPIVNPSSTASDVLSGAGTCTGVGFQQQTGATPATPLLGVAGLPVQGRCGYGTRIPLLVVSPFAKKNYIDHTLTDQSSVLRFVEDNWLAGERIQTGGSFDTIAGPIDNMFQF